MTAFKILQQIQKNTKKVQPGFWSVTSLTSHRVVSNIVKLTSGKYGTTHNMAEHSSFMAALASLIPLCVKAVSKAGVIRSMVIGAILAVSAVSGQAHAADKYDLMKAESQIADLGQKSFLLDKTVSDADKSDADLAGFQISRVAQDTVKTQAAEAVNRGESCEDFSSDVNSRMQNVLDTDPDYATQSDQFKHANGQLQKAVTEYASMVCEYLKAE